MIAHYVFTAFFQDMHLHFFLGALIYRVIPPRSEGHKLGLKCGHAIIMMVTFVIMVIGLQVSHHPDNNL